MIKPYEKYELVKSLKAALKMAEGLETTTPCEDCAHFDKRDKCSIWGESVPKEAQKVGCDKFIYDEIPF